MFRSMKAFLRRSQRSVRNMDGSQKLGVLHEGSEVESKTSKIVTVFVKIRFCFEACSWQEYGKSR